MKLILGLLLLASMNASATEVVKVCNYCNSYDSFAYAAVDSADKAGLSGIVKVINPTTGEIMNFSMRLESREPGVINNFVAVDEGISAVDEELAQQVRQNLESLHAWFNANKDVPSSVLTSAYQLVGVSSNLTKLQTFYNDTRTIGQYYSSYLGALASIGGKVVGVNVVIELKFSDLPMVTLKISGINANGELQFQILSITDSDGNNIPLNQTEFAEKSNEAYKFSNEHKLQQFLETAWRMGIKTVNLAYGSYGVRGTVTITDCRKNSICTIKKVTK